MTNQPISLLSLDSLHRVMDEAFQILQTSGVRVSDKEALNLLKNDGAAVENDIARIPAALIDKALATVPRKFDLFDRSGHQAVHYGGDIVHFDPGSCAPHILDAQTGEHRNSTSADLINIVKVTEMLPQFAAQSTAVVCHDAPPNPATCTA